MIDPPFATVLVPTHEDRGLIGYALRSIQQQSLRDFELLVVGDGAPPATREVVEQLARSDPRIQYFDFPKGERHGEASRHTALQCARGRVVAYCGDDDLWFPDHLSSLSQLLCRADFGNSLQAAVFRGDKVTIRLGNLARARTRRRIQAGLGYFGLSEAAHTMAIYRSLPDGWGPAPTGTHTDQYMFRKFLALPGIRCGSTGDVTAIHFPSPVRSAWSRDERETELRQYFERMMAGGLHQEFRAAITRTRIMLPALWSRRLVGLTLRRLGLR